MTDSSTATTPIASPTGAPVPVADNDTDQVVDQRRERHRQGNWIVSDGVPLPNPQTTTGLLTGTVTGRWLGSHRDVVHGRLLDLGCGNRPMEPWYEPLVDSVVAVDPAPGAGQNVQAFAHQLPVQADSIDVILCTQALEHVEQIEQAAGEMARVLRPGGHALITVPFLYPTHEAPYDFYRFTYIGLARLMERSGLEVVDQGAQGGPGLMLASWALRAARAVIDKIGRMFGSSKPLGLRQPFNALLVAPQRLILRLQRGSGAQLTPLRRLVSNGYLLLVRKPL